MAPSVCPSLYFVTRNSFKLNIHLPHLSLAGHTVFRISPDEISCEDFTETFFADEAACGDDTIMGG